MKKIFGKIPPRVQNYPEGARAAGASEKEIREAVHMANLATALAHSPIWQ